MLRFVVLPTNKSGAQSDLQEDHWTQAREFPSDYFGAWWPQSSSSRIVMYFYHRCYNISPSYISLACGFYRVNSSTCSDININLLWPSDGTRRQRFGSTLVQVMACCLTAPSHYLDECWLIISGVLWLSPESHFTWYAQDSYLWNKFENYWFKITNTPPRDQWDKVCIGVTQQGQMTQKYINELDIIGSNIH